MRPKRPHQWLFTLRSAWGAQQTEPPPGHDGATSSPETSRFKPFPSRVPAVGPRPGQGAALWAAERAGSQRPRGPAAGSVSQPRSNRKIRSPRVKVRAGAGGWGHTDCPFPGTACTSLRHSRGSCLPSRGVVILNLVLPFKRLPSTGTVCSIYTEKAINKEVLKKKKGPHTVHSARVTAPRCIARASTVVLHLAVS